MRRGDEWDGKKRSRLGVPRERALLKDALEDVVAGYVYRDFRIRYRISRLGSDTTVLTSCIVPPSQQVRMRQDGCI